MISFVTAWLGLRLTRLFNVFAIRMMHSFNIRSDFIVTPSHEEWLGYAFTVENCTDGDFETVPHLIFGTA